jgi:soluble lytic murein transglycosylase-like protein
MRTGCGLASLTLLLAATALPAEVKLELRPDGIPVIRNESPAMHARRLATHLLPPPSPALGDLVERWSSARDLDPRLVEAVMQVESGFNPKALSDKGAIGLMQLMPETARELAVKDPWDPDENVRGGTEYLRRMIDFFHGDVELALAAYNAGPGAVLDHAGVPPYRDTQAYVRRVLCLRDDSCPEDDGPVGRKVELRRDADGGLVILNTGTDG